MFVHSTIRESFLVSGFRPQEGCAGRKAESSSVNASSHLLCPQPLGNVPPARLPSALTENTWKRPLRAGIHY